MKQTKPRKLLTVLMALVMIATCLVSPALANPAESSNSAVTAVSAITDAKSGEISYTEAQELDPKLDPNREISIMVELDGQTIYQQTGNLQLAAAGHDSQLVAIAQAERQVEAVLKQSIAVDSRFGLLFNGFSFSGQLWMVDAINAIEGMTAYEAPMFDLIEASTEEVNLTPNMSTSNQMISTGDAWALGYTGEGMVIAIIDSGIRQTHEVFSVMPENGKIDKAYLQEVFDTHGANLHCGTDADAMYYNEKLPFNWDYYDKDAVPNHTNSDHGTHVAGIAAGNNGKDFKGVAPDAQIVTMQVAESSGGISLVTLMEALEDCIYLDVDVINMSLGISAYFTSYASISSKLEGIYDALEAAGITVCAAAGNDQHSNFWVNPNIGYDMGWFSWNVDVGTVGAPATFPGSFCVSSVQNAGNNGGYLIAYGSELYPQRSVTSTVPGIRDLPEGEYDIVYAGYASVAELAELDVKGKIVLSERGVETFGGKGNNAAAAGAVGILVYNNEPGPVASAAVTTIPFGTLSQEEGMLLRENFADGVNGKVTVSHGFAYGLVQMALTSSWGTTADLRIKPEIAAPGDKITSAIGFEGDSSYATWSGTSMATPHVAGGMLLIKQRLKEILPDKTAAEINELAYAYMMSTAHKFTSNVRRAGAGLMDLKGALTTEAYLSVEGQNRPKLELDDSENGEFTFSFTVNNVGDTAKTYDVVPTVLTESAGEMKYTGYRETDTTRTKYIVYNRKNDYFLSNYPTATTVKLMKGSISDVTAQCDITAPETVTVAAGSTATVEMTIKASAELLTYIQENFTSGMYLEGYVTLEDQDESGVDLSIPFLGFVGDWDYGPMFDMGFWWNLPYGQVNLAQMPVSQGTYLGDGVLEQGLGLNYYASMKGKNYVADRNAISPNGDGLLDKVSYIEFSLMRNPKTVKLYVQDAEGNVVKSLYDKTYGLRKEYFVEGWNGGTTYSNIIFNYVADEMEENETAYIVLEAWLDHEEYDITANQNGRMVFPVTKDLTAPQVSVIDGGIQILDTNYIAYYGVYSDSQMRDALVETGVFAEERGVAETVMTDLDTLFVKVADYARNEAFYMVRDGQIYVLNNDAFGHSTKEIIGRSYLNWNLGGYEYAWYTFNPETPNAVTAQTAPTYAMNDYVYYGFDYLGGAVAKNGQCYVNSSLHLHTFNPDTYETEVVGEFWSDDGSVLHVRNLMTNPETGDIYAFVHLSCCGSGYHMAEVNLETAELTEVWRLDDSLAVDADYFSWSAQFVSGDTIAIWMHSGSIWLVDAEDCWPQKEINLGLTAPSGEAQYGIDGNGGNMIYDEKENQLYLFSPKCSWFGFHRYNTHGYITFDLDNSKVTMRRLAGGSELGIQGLFLREDVKPEICVCYQEIVAPTCETEGYTLNICVDCGRETRENFVPALGHDYELVVVDPTCTKAGYTMNHCSICDEHYILDVIDPTGHSYNTEITAPTCTEVGYTTYICDCGERYVSDYVDALGHSFGQWVITTEPGCTENGSETRTCDRCDATETQEVPACCPAEGFIDVNTKQWYHDGVCYALRNGLMNGMSETEFAPENNMTRAQLVTVLYRLAGSPSVEGLEHPFADVAAETWYTDAVIWAYNAEVVNGVSDTAFAPNANITREQIAAILYRYAGAEVVEEDSLKDFTDAGKVNAYAVDAMNWAVSVGLINGVAEGELAPQGNATRAQIATILMRYCEG